ncbi:MAG TPA: J domain-containing protein [Stenomitos sp.]
MTQDKNKDSSKRRFAKPLGVEPTYYSLLDLSPTATSEEIRKAYRLKSKLYHPDTTELPAEVAVEKFQQLNKAYAVLSNSERRIQYDAYPQSYFEDIAVEIEARNSFVKQAMKSKPTATASLDPKERPLSAGEIFAVFILGITFVICLALAIILGIARGEMVIQTSVQSHLSAAKSLSMPQPVQNTKLLPSAPQPMKLKPSVTSSNPVSPTLSRQGQKLEQARQGNRTQTTSFNQTTAFKKS